MKISAANGCSSRARVAHRRAQGVPALHRIHEVSMQRETEKFFEHIVLAGRRSVLDFIEADYSFLDQRLAEYYGIPGVEGTEFRKVTLRRNHTAEA